MEALNHFIYVCLGLWHGIECISRFIYVRNKKSFGYNNL